MPAWIVEEMNRRFELDFGQVPPRAPGDQQEQVKQTSAGGKREPTLLSQQQPTHQHYFSSPGPFAQKQANVSAAELYEAQRKDLEERLEREKVGTDAQRKQHAGTTLFDRLQPKPATNQKEEEEEAVIAGREVLGRRIDVEGGGQGGGEVGGRWGAPNAMVEHFERKHGMSRNLMTTEAEGRREEEEEEESFGDNIHSPPRLSYTLKDEERSPKGSHRRRRYGENSDGACANDGFGVLSPMSLQSSVYNHQHTYNDSSPPPSSVSSRSLLSTKLAHLSSVLSRMAREKARAKGGKGREEFRKWWRGRRERVEGVLEEVGRIRAELGVGA